MITASLNIMPEAVRGYRGLYVADASALPGVLGAALTSSNAVRAAPALGPR